MTFTTDEYQLIHKALRKYQLGQIVGSKWYNEIDEVLRKIDEETFKDVETVG
jgi:hypothetical protein